MPATPPFGYRHTEGRLVEDEYEQETLGVLAEYRRRKPPLSYGNIAAELNRQGRLNRGKYWNPTTLWYIAKRNDMK